MNTKMIFVLICLLVGISSYSQNSTMYFEISLNDTFQISHYECRGCGYSDFWINKSSVKAVDSIYEKIIDNNPPGWAGGYQTYFWSFKGVKVGLDTIKLVYGHLWDETTWETSFIIVKVSESDTTTSNYDIFLQDSFPLNLLSNPTEGYSWIWFNKQLNSNIDTVDYKFVSVNPNIPGSKGKEKWNFKAKNVGIDTVKLKYIKSSNPDSIILTKNIVFKVNDSNPTFIPGLSESKLIKIYPNPTKGILEIDFMETNGKSYLCEIYNTDGKKTLSESFIDSKAIINVGSFNAGVYLLTIRQNNNLIFSSRFIKE
jgi:predicted secreted protein